MKITQFDKLICKTFRKAIEQAIQKTAKEFGVSIKQKSGSFSPTNYTFKMEASVIGKNGLVFSKDVEDFKIYCRTFNLKLSDLGKTFTADDGIVYKIKGLSPRSRKFPILVEDTNNGKAFKLPERMVQRGLGRKVKDISMLSTW